MKPIKATTKKEQSNFTLPANTKILIDKLSTHYSRSKNAIVDMAIKELYASMNKQVKEESQKDERTLFELFQEQTRYLQKLEEDFIQYKIDSAVKMELNTKDLNEKIDSRFTKRMFILYLQNPDEVKAEILKNTKGK